jgi:hypothetical protein
MEEPMQNNVLFLGWNGPKVGREKLAGELYQSLNNFWAKYEQDGKIDGYDGILLSNHGGDLNGFFLVKGAVEHLAEIRNSDEFTKLSLQCDYALDGFGIIGGYYGDELSSLMTQWNQLIG